MGKIKKMPKQYEVLFDDVVLKIADEARRIIPAIEELGNRLEFEVDKHVVIIKKIGDEREGETK